MSKTFKRAKAIQDDSSHWYVIPSELEKEFRQLLEGGEEAENLFIEKFSQYMTGGDVNRKQLYAEFEE